MQNPINNPETNVEQSAPAVNQQSQSASTLMKDLAVPLSIVIAGIFVGAGLYFGGTGGASVGQVAPLPSQQEQNEGGLVPALVERAGVSEKDFNECFASGRLDSKVSEDMDNAVATGGRGTPWSILVGPTGKTYPINGALPQQAIEQLIELAKSEAGQTSADSANPDTNLVAPISADDHMKGNIDATIKIIEYSDFDCPFCSRYHTVMDTIVKKYGSDELVWVYRHFPLEQLHPNAEAVAIASECVGEIGGDEAFWIFTDGYFSSK